MTLIKRMKRFVHLHCVSKMLILCFCFYQVAQNHYSGEVKKINQLRVAHLPPLVMFVPITMKGKKHVCLSYS